MDEPCGPIVLGWAALLGRWRDAGVAGAEDPDVVPLLQRAYFLGAMTVLEVTGAEELAVLQRELEGCWADAHWYVAEHKRRSGHGG